MTREAVLFGGRPQEVNIIELLQDKVVVILNCQVSLPRTLKHSVSGGAPLYNNSCSTPMQQRLQLWV